MSDDDDLGDEDPGEQVFREDQDAIIAALAGVMEDRGMSEEELVPMLIGALYHFRSLAYVVETAKPSESGLRMNLDRMRKMIEEIHRDYRKDAAAVIRDIVAILDTLAQTEREDEVVAPTAVLSNGGDR